jgi:hypothetical protein
MPQTFANPAGRRGAALLLALGLPWSWAPAGGDANADWSPRLADPVERRSARTVDDALDAYFADDDPHARRAALRRLAKVPAGLGADDLRRIARAAPPAGALPLAEGLWRVPLPWDPNAARGWFTLSIPPDYTPAKAWPLAICLHGSDSDGGNMVPLVNAHLARAGVLAIYPTSGDADRLWSAPPETMDVYRLISWTGRRYRVDFGRLIVLGGSMGGMGAWSHVLGRPDVWCAGASAGGHPPSLAGRSIDALRRVPFYVLHGSLDTDGASLAPVERVRQAVASLHRRGVEVTYVEVPGAGHTPPDKHFARMASWLASRRGQETSPRGLFLPPPGRRAIWELWPATCGLSDANDPALRAIQRGRADRALTSLTARLARDDGGESRAKLLALRAVARLPGLLGPVPDVLDANGSPARDGWVEAREAAALGDLRRALEAEGGKGAWSALFDASAWVLVARVHARRLGASLEAGDGRWARHYNAAISACRAALRAQPDHRQAVALLRAIRERLSSM